MRVSVTSSGFRAVRSHLGRRQAARLRRQVGEDIEQGVRDMAETSHGMAPEDTSALKQSILASVKRNNLMDYMYGSILPYAQRQNYEHKTKRYYFERAVEKELPMLQSKIESSVKHRTGAE